MGFFEFFTTTDKGKEVKFEKKADRKAAKKNSGTFSRNPNPVQTEQPQQINSQSTIQTFSPTSFEEVAMIIDNLCNGYPAIVKLDDIDPATAQRVVDLLSGAIHAIKGNVSHVSGQTFIFTPQGAKAN